MILTDAVDQRLIPANPIHKRRRRGRRSRRITPEKVWATPEQVLRIADQAGMLGGPIARLLIITAAWTGCRWGELTGPHRRNVDLRRGLIIIDPHEGSLHESHGERWIGPPKTPASARRILLPPFLIDLLRAHLDTHPYDYVFTTPRGAWLWRSTFIRRILRPAVDGNLDILDPPVRTVAVRRGLTFHGLRHSHKTWLIADGIPEIAQARRMGHHLDNRIVETYSHVAPELEQQLLNHLEHRWHTAQHTRQPAAGTTPAPQPGTNADTTNRTATPHATASPPSPTQHPHTAAAENGTGGDTSARLDNHHARHVTLNGRSPIPNSNAALDQHNSHTQKELTHRHGMNGSPRRGTDAIPYYSETGPEPDVTTVEETTRCNSVTPDEQAS